MSKLFNHRPGLSGMNPWKPAAWFLCCVIPCICAALSFPCVRRHCSARLQSLSRGLTPKCQKTGLNWNEKLESPIQRSKQYTAWKLFPLHLKTEMKFSWWSIAQSPTISMSSYCVNIVIFINKYWGTAGASKISLLGCCGPVITSGCC